MKRIAFFAAAILIVLAAVSVTAITDGKKYKNLEDKYVSDIEADRAQIDSLRAELQSLTEERQAEADILTDILRKVDCKDEPVYVIGHKTPDFDTTASAIGMSYLLNKLGLKAEARIAGPLNLETEYGLSAVGYPSPEILENADGKQLWLVDHSDFRLAVDGADKARIVGITDHHGIGDAETSELISVISCPAGSTSALVYLLCAKCGVDVPQDIAKVLLAGILSDTTNMKSSGVCTADEFALAQLKEISGISDTNALFDGMLEAKLSFNGMTDREIFYSDYKEYETHGVVYGVGVIKIARSDKVPDMSERMLSVIENEVKNGSDIDFLLFEVYDADYSLGYMGFCGSDAEFTEKVIDAAFGSTGEKQGRFYSFSPSLSRKTDVIPPIDNYINALGT